VHEFLREFLNKKWSHSSLNHLLEKSTNLVMLNALSVVVNHGQRIMHGKAAKQSSCGGIILYIWCPSSVPHLPAKNYKCSFKFAKIIVKKIYWTLFLWTQSSTIARLFGIFV